MHSCYYLIQNLKGRKIRQQGWSKTERSAGSNTLIFSRLKKNFTKKLDFLHYYNSLLQNLRVRKVLLTSCYFCYFFLLTMERKWYKIKVRRLKTFLCTAMSKERLNNFTPLEIYKILLNGLNLFSIAKQSVSYNIEKYCKKMDPKLTNLEKSITNFQFMNKNILILLLLYGNRNMSDSINIFFSNVVVNDTHRGKLVLYSIQYKNSLKYKVGCFWHFSYVYTIN